jgi:hypothetical protein
VRVLDPAILRAHPEIRTGFLGRESQDVALARDRVDLAGELGHPKGVNHVVGHEADLHRLPDGHAQFVGGDDLPSRIADLPPPPLPCHLDTERVVAGLSERVGRRHRDNRKDEEDQRRHDEAPDDDEHARTDS